MSTSSLPDGLIWDHAVETFDEIERLSTLVWPRYLLEPGDIPESDPPESPEEAEHRSIFHAWGIRREETGELVAATTALSLRIDPEAPFLPDEGWRYAARACLLDVPPNALSLLSASVHPEYRRHGLSRLMLEEGKRLAVRLGLSSLIGPVRPSAKERHPGITMEDYLYREGGIDTDPWLRTHRELGGEVLNICARSVQVIASIARWQEWTGEIYERSGEYPLPMGLVPLSIDIERGTGTYIEPNVWVRYRLTE